MRLHKWVHKGKPLRNSIIKKSIESVVFTGSMLPIWRLQMETMTSQMKIWSFLWMIITGTKKFFKTKPRVPCMLNCSLTLSLMSPCLAIERWARQAWFRPSWTVLQTWSTQENPSRCMKCLICISLPRHARSGSIKSGSKTALNFPSAFKILKALAIILRWTKCTETCMGSSLSVTSRTCNRCVTYLNGSNKSRARLT